MEAKTKQPTVERETEDGWWTIHDEEDPEIQAAPPCEVQSRLHSDQSAADEDTEMKTAAEGQKPAQHKRAKLQADTQTEADIHTKTKTLPQLHEEICAIPCGERQMYIDLNVTEDQVWYDQIKTEPALLEKDASKNDVHHENDGLKNGSQLEGGLTLFATKHPPCTCAEGVLWQRGSNRSDLEHKSENGFHLEAETKQLFEEKQAPDRDGHIQVDRHMQIQLRIQPYMCSQCESAFSRKYDLTRHQLIHTSLKPHQCIECDARFALNSQLKKHMQTHTGIKPYRCTKCENSFTEARSLRRHMLIHAGLRPHECPQCGARFTEACNLRKHIRSHMDIKPYKCTLCDASFTRNNHLQAHMQYIHRGIKLHQCIECSSSFTRADNLKRHMLTHTGTKVHQCTLCDSKFTQSAHLKVHMLKHSSVKAYPCPQCPSSFKRAGDMRRHLQTCQGSN